MPDMEDRGPLFDGVRVGRPATGGLVDAGYRSVADLPAELDELLALHGVGPRAVRLLREHRDGSADATDTPT
jgi:endonuclease III